MKKLLFLIAFVAFLISSATAQKFVYGELVVKGNANISGTTNIQGAVNLGKITTTAVVVDSIRIASKLVKYVEGDSLTNRAYVKANYTGNLTDDTPTAAEITAIIGTPASKGSGFRAVIKDANGSGLLYLVISYTTSWGFTKLTTAQ